MAIEGTFTSKEIQEFISGPRFDPDLLRSGNSSYPRISVIMPSYNQGAFLERAFLSILNQNYPNTQLMVFDAGSTDNSVEIIGKYEQHIDYWVSEPDKGQPSAINKGFARANGELIGWQNSDDLYLPGYFHTVAESFREEPTAQLFVGNIYTTDEDDQITWGSHYTPFSLQHLIYLGWNLSSQTTFLTRDMIDSVGPMREDIHVEFDYDWFIRVGKEVRRAVLHRGYGGCYRIHSKSKLSLQPAESRWPIETQIYKSHGIQVREDVTREGQWWLRRRLLKIRHYFLLGLLYYPVTRTGKLARVPFPSISYRVISALRPMVLWCLSKVSKTKIS